MAPASPKRELLPRPGVADRALRIAGGGQPADVAGRRCAAVLNGCARCCAICAGLLIGHAGHVELRARYLVLDRLLLLRRSCVAVNVGMLTSMPVYGSCQV